MEIVRLCDVTPNNSSQLNPESEFPTKFPDELQSQICLNLGEHGSRRRLNLGDLRTTKCAYASKLSADVRILIDLGSATPIVRNANSASSLFAKRQKYISLTRVLVQRFSSALRQIRTYVRIDPQINFSPKRQKNNQYQKKTAAFYDLYVSQFLHTIKGRNLVLSLVHQIQQELEHYPSFVHFTVQLTRMTNWNYC